MAKDDFDMDFHFDDDDFDPKAFLDGEDGADIDLSEFDDVPSGGDKLDETVADGYDDDIRFLGNLYFVQRIEEGFRRDR